MIDKLQEVPEREEVRFYRQDELPDEDGKPVETFRELPQSRLLCDTLEPVIRAAHPNGRFIIGSNSGIYWRFTTPPLDGCLAPDWYYVPDVNPDPPGEVRRSYHFPNEHQSPRLLVELVSNDEDTEHDMTPHRGKMWVYEQVLHAEYYVIYDPYDVTLEVWAFDAAVGGFVPIAANAHGRFPIAVMNIEMGIWHGEFSGRVDSWLRPWDAHGNLLPSKDDVIAIQTRRADAQTQRADDQANRADRLRRQRDLAESAIETRDAEIARLAELLRLHGIDPTTSPPEHTEE